jgi:myo-inositol-1(or 4)-monophosphatase
MCWLWIGAPTTTKLRFFLKKVSRFAVPDALGDASVPAASELERIAIVAAEAAAVIVRNGYGSAQAVGTKSSATDVVTQTDIDSERRIVEMLELATPHCGIIGEESGARRETSRLQWIIDPLDGTVNFLYGIPVFSVSIAAAVDGAFVAGAVVDVMREETFAARLGGGARMNGVSIHVSSCDDMSRALILTGFSYTARLRALQGYLVRGLLPFVRDIRCFGSAAIEMCWVANGRSEAYFERDTKIWDWAAGSLIAEEAGAVLELPCPENDGLVLAAPPALIEQVRALTCLPD